LLQGPGYSDLEVELPTARNFQELQLEGNLEVGPESDTGVVEGAGVTQTRELNDTLARRARGLSVERAGFGGVSSDFHMCTAVLRADPARNARATSWPNQILHEEVVHSFHGSSFTVSCSIANLERNVLDVTVLSVRISRGTPATELFSVGQEDLIAFTVFQTVVSAVAASSLQLASTRRLGRTSLTGGRRRSGDTVSILENLAFRTAFSVGFGPSVNLIWSTADTLEGLIVVDYNLAVSGAAKTSTSRLIDIACLAYRAHVRDSAASHIPLWSCVWFPSGIASTVVVLSYCEEKGYEEERGEE